MRFEPGLEEISGEGRPDREGDAVRHSLGAAQAKARSPLILRFVCGTARSPVVDYLRVLEVE